MSYKRYENTWCDLSGRENSQGKSLWKLLSITRCCVLSVTLSRFCHRFSLRTRRLTWASQVWSAGSASRMCVFRWWLLNRLCSSVRLYAVGGRDGSSCLRSVECFDPHTNKWSMCAPMSKRRGGVGVATYNNFLYAVGGHDAPASNHCSRLSDCVERWVSVCLRKEKSQWNDLSMQSGEFSAAWERDPRLLLTPPSRPAPKGMSALTCTSLQGRAHGCHRWDYVTVSGTTCCLILESLKWEFTWEKKIFFTIYSRIPILSIMNLYI